LFSRARAWGLLGAAGDECKRRLSFDGSLLNPYKNKNRQMLGESYHPIKEEPLK